MTGVSAHEGLTASVSATKLATAHRWIRAKFEGLQETKTAEGCLMGGLESSQIQKNEVTTQGYGLYAIANRPLRAADQDYPRGLHFLKAKLWFISQNQQMSLKPLFG